MLNIKYYDLGIHEVAYKFKSMCRLFLNCEVGKEIKDSYRFRKEEESI